MSDLLDVMESTASSGATMTTTLYDYGNGSLGGGILRLASEMKLVGYEQGAMDVAPIAFDSGLLRGRKEGVIGTVIVVGAATLLTWGIYKLTKKNKGKDTNIYSFNGIYSSEDGLELTVGEHIEVLQQEGKMALIRKTSEPSKVYSVPLEIINEMLKPDDVKTIKQ